MPRPTPFDPSRLTANTRVRLLAAHDDLPAGALLVVERVDRSDGTVICTTQDGTSTGWIPRKKLVPHHAVGWDFLRSALTPAGRALLEAFDGHERLSLRAEVADAVIQTLPDLEAAVRRARDAQRDVTAAPRRSKAGPKRPWTWPPSPRPAAGEPKPDLGDLDALVFGTREGGV